METSCPSLHQKLLQGWKAGLSETCWVANSLAWGEHCRRMKLCSARVSAGILEMTGMGTATLSTGAISQIRSLANNVPQEGKQAMELGKSSHSLSLSTGGVTREQSVTLLWSQSPSQSPQRQNIPSWFSLGVCHNQHHQLFCLLFSASSLKTHAQLYPRKPSSRSLPPDVRAKLPVFFCSVTHTVSAIHSLKDHSSFLLRRGARKGKLHFLAPAGFTHWSRAMHTALTVKLGRWQQQQ